MRTGCECKEPTPKETDGFKMTCKICRTSWNKLAGQLQKESDIVDRLCAQVNGYEQDKMLKDIKQLVIDNGGYQNAYTISHLVELIGKAKIVRSERN